MKKVFVVDESPHMTFWRLYATMVHLGMAEIISTHSAADYFHKYKPNGYTFMQEFYKDGKR